MKTAEKQAKPTTLYLVVAEGKRGLRSDVKIVSATSRASACKLSGLTAGEYQKAPFAVEVVDGLSMVI